MTDTKAIMQALITMGLETGLFDSVNGHEPKSAPALGNACTLALFSGPVTTINSSGLASASMRWQIDGRIFLSAFTEPADDIDPAIVNATLVYLRKLAGAFTLGGLVRCVDMFGMDGDKLNATAGYMEQDKKVYRVMDLMIPLLLNDELDLVA